MATIKPSKEYVFARPEEAQRTTTTGLILTEDAAYKPEVAVVLAVGSNVTEFKVNDRIVYKAFTTTEIKLDGTEYVLLNQEDILGVVA